MSLIDRLVGYLGVLAIKQIYDGMAEWKSREHMDLASVILRDIISPHDPPATPIAPALGREGDLQAA